MSAERIQKKVWKQNQLGIETDDGLEQGRKTKLVATITHITGWRIHESLETYKRHYYINKETTHW